MFDKPFVPSGKETLAADLHYFLRHSILQGDLEAGTKMVEQTIANETSTSRTPVRDALRQLEVAGLVRHEGRGFVVAKFSSGERCEAWVVIETLHRLAAKLAAVNRSNLHLRQLNHLIAVGRAATAANDGSALVEINRNFHAAVHRASENRYLFDLIQPTVLQIETLQDFTTNRRRIQAQKEHEVIAAAIEAQDTAKAEKAILTHLQNQRVHAFTETPLSLAHAGPTHVERASAGERPTTHPQQARQGASEA